jgi:hypothetical protein
VKSLIAIALLVNASAAAAVPVKAAEPPCVTKAEFRSLSLFVLPSVIEGAAARCEAHLPVDAYLLNGARRLANTVAREREIHKPGATAALARIAGGKVPEGLSGDTIALLVTELTRSELLKNLDGKGCVDVDETATLLAPLPAENLVGLVGQLMRLGTRADKRPPFRICAARAL